MSNEPNAMQSYREPHCEVYENDAQQGAPVGYAEQIMPIWDEDEGAWQGWVYDDRENRDMPIGMFESFTEAKEAVRRHAVQLHKINTLAALFTFEGVLAGDEDYGFDPDQQKAEQKAEQDAENAWLRWAEGGSPESQRYRDEVDEDLRRNGEPGL